MYRREGDQQVSCFVDHPTFITRKKQLKSELREKRRHCYLISNVPRAINRPFVFVEQVCVLDRLKTVVPVDLNDVRTPRLSLNRLFGKAMCDEAFTTYLVLTIPEGN